MGATRQLVGSRKSIDIRELVRAGLRAPGDILTMRWHTSRQESLPGSSMVTMLDAGRLHLTHFGVELPPEILDLTYTVTPFAGRRAWFACSQLGCGKRVAILHATPKGFRCRHCTHLVYGSQFEQPHDRLLRRMRKLRSRVGGSINLVDPFPGKPKGMHWMVYDKLLMRELHFWQALSTWTGERYGCS